MTETSNTPKTVDRAPIVNDIVIIAPNSGDLFDVVALDELYGDMIYVRRHSTEDSAKWVFLTHVKVVDDESPDAWA